MSMTGETGNMGDVAPPGFHKHWCHHCDHIWQHDSWNMGDIKAHTCPKCGKVLPHPWEPYVEPSAEEQLIIAQANRRQRRRKLKARPRRRR